MITPGSRFKCTEGFGLYSSFDQAVCYGDGLIGQVEVNQRGTVIASLPRSKVKPEDRDRSLFNVWCYVIIDGGGLGWTILRVNEVVE